MRVILDTNVIVSGLISTHGPPSRILDYWRGGFFTLLYSADILDEIQDVLGRAWFQRRMAHVPDRISDLLEAMIKKGELIDSDFGIRYAKSNAGLRDPFDERFLICALLGHADYLVSGDKDLLILETIGATHIVSPTYFSAMLDAI